MKPLDEVQPFIKEVPPGFGRELESLISEMVNFLYHKDVDDGGFLLKRVFSFIDLIEERRDCIGDNAVLSETHERLNDWDQRPVDPGTAMGQWDALQLLAVLVPIWKLWTGK